MTETGRQRLVEVVSVLVIALCVAAVAVPKSGDLQRGDASQRVLDDIELLRGAVYQFYSDSAYFPAEAPSDAVPAGLAAYLPARFSAHPAYGTLRYRHWSVPAVATDTAAPPPAAAPVVGVTVTTTDPRVGAGAAALAPAMPEFSVGNTYTFILFGS